MWRFTLKRLLNIILTLFFLSIFIFFLVRVTPGTPEMVILLNRGGEIGGEEVVDIKTELGHDTSLYNQYVNWSKRMIRFDFGVSYQSNLPVLDELLSRVSDTLILVILSLAISIILSVIISFYACIYKGTMREKWIGNISIFLSSLPNYLIGLLLVLFFSIHWKVTPVYGDGTWLHYILPVITASLPLCASFVQLFRQIITEVIKNLYFEAARAMGLKKRVLYTKFLFLPCIHSFLTVIASHFGSLWGTIIVIETIYAWPGLGSYIIHAVTARDYPVVIGFTLIMALFLMLIYFLIDLLLRYIDPRQTQKDGQIKW
ncbi:MULTISPECIES: ABC transporter permease [Virgibacillus]|uniref:Peptide/nickel transport system permease protein/nickel transport system permease protein n=1 Tax=Virgibacillus chiguensis TaxID=411959 RepID=A0A1M5MEI0_9BACI|nr:MULTISPECIES: ABC transporter permease [Virgibacillus]SHG75715.1 peptide/nickel transport system permease protein/nickel transport system permease protein [Virgibacillus chiguensis]